MTSGQAEPQEPRVPPEASEQLEAATPGERFEIVLRLIEDHPEGQLELPATGDHPAMLEGADLRSLAQRGRSLRGGALLRGARLRQAKLARLDMAHADLRGAALGEADLRGANLEGADLRGADLAGANLRGAALGEANLQGAMLEEVDLRGAGLRFSQLQEAVLENSNLEGADLWGAQIAGAELSGARLRRATLKEADLKGANLARDLRGAVAGKANFAAARLEAADLRGADLEGASFRGAVLRGARLQGLDLSVCDIAGIHVSGAWLDKARFSQAQLSGAIGEERDGDYDEARKGYLALERVFQDLGDYDAASWAYRRRRRMQKREALARAGAARLEGHWRIALQSCAEYAGDQFVEWLCDYGESIPRVLGSLLAVYLAFTITYGLTGSVVRVVETPGGAIKVATWNLLDLATFSLLAMSTSGSPTVDLLPADRTVHFLTAAEALLGIGLTGLLGFVAGNRIRR